MHQFHRFAAVAMTMSLLPYLILLVLVHESFENGVVFTECDYTQCGGREPIYTPFKSYNVSFRMECLIRCLDNSFCNFVGHHDKQCTLYPSLDPLYDMQPSDLEWRFWSRRESFWNIIPLGSTYICTHQKVKHIFFIVNHRVKKCNRTVRIHGTAVLSLLRRISAYRQHYHVYRKTFFST